MSQITPKLPALPAARDIAGLIAVFCIVTAIHGPFGSALEEAPSAASRAVVIFLYVGSAVVLLLAAAALAAVLISAIHPGRKKTPSAETAPRPTPASVFAAAALSGDDPEAWHPGDTL